MEKFLVSPSPHIESDLTTKKIMQKVCIALAPAALASILIYGFYPLMVMILTVGSCILAEFLFNKIAKKPTTITDWSAVVTGLILALNLPPVVPFYIPIIASFFAIFVVKMLFGGLGKNFANPAITARIFCLLAWSSAMTAYVAPISYTNGSFFAELFKYFPYGFGIKAIDAVSTATPLAIIKNSIGQNAGLNVPILNMLLGYTGGSAGEVSAIAILIGGVYLIINKIIDWKIPTLYILSSAFFSLIFYKQGYLYILPSILGGGLLFGAFFMATDYSTSPNTKVGVIIYAIGCGFITILIRRFGGYPEGVSFAILLMNLVTPLLDKYLCPRAFGAPHKKLKKEKKQNANA